VVERARRGDTDWVRVAVGLEARVDRASRLCLKAWCRAEMQALRWSGQSSVHGVVGDMRWARLGSGRGRQHALMDELVGAALSGPRLSGRDAEAPAQRPKRARDVAGCSCRLMRVGGVSPKGGP
jgi:hypothetical protein